MYTDGRYLFRAAEIDDVKVLWEMEKICFPKNEPNIPPIICYFSLHNA